MGGHQHVHGPGRLLEQGLQAVLRRHHRPERLGVGPDRLRVERGEQLLLRREVGVQRGRADAGARRQVPHAQGQVATFGDAVPGGVEDVDPALFAIAPAGLAIRNSNSV